MTDFEEKSRIQLARDRTGWASERTLLANERNFSAWLRTGLAALGAGLGIGKLLGSLGMPMITRTIGVVCIIMSGTVFIIAWWRYKQIYEDLADQGMRVTPMWMIHLIIIGMLLSDVLAIILMFTTSR